MLTDLTKTFDCINHRLLIAKLYAYGLTLSQYDTYTATLQTEHQELKSINLLVNGADLNMVFHKTHFWGLFYSINISVTYCLIVLK